MNYHISNAKGPKKLGRAVCRGAQRLNNIRNSDRYSTTYVRNTLATALKPNGTLPQL